MLTLRQDQFDVFAIRAREAVASRATEIMRAKRPEVVAGLNEVTLRRRVLIGLMAGWMLGMRKDVPLITFAAMVVEFGPRFERHSAVAPVIADPNIAPDEIVDALLERLPSIVWDELAILGAGADWERP